MNRQYEIGRAPDGSYVFARAFRLSFTLKLAMEVASELKPLAEKLGALGLLLDLRGTTSLTSNFEKYNFANKDTVNIGVPRLLKTALLKDSADDSPDFMEIVMNNAGYQFKIFEDEREAINWLKGIKPANMVPKTA